MFLGLKRKSKPEGSEYRRFGCILMRQVPIGTRSDNMVHRLPPPLMKRAYWTGTGRVRDMRKLMWHSQSTEGVPRRSEATVAVAVP